MPKPFTAPDIKVTNNTKVAVIATVESMKAASGGSLTFIDVDPSAKAWRSLNLADSKKVHCARNLPQKANSGWNSGYSTSTHWAVNDSPLQVRDAEPEHFRRAVPHGGLRPRVRRGVHGQPSACFPVPARIKT
jgi:hypothetical protein